MDNNKIIQRKMQALIKTAVTIFPNFKPTIIIKHRENKQKPPYIITDIDPYNLIDLFLEVAETLKLNNSDSLENLKTINKEIRIGKADSFKKEAAKKLKEDVTQINALCTESFNKNGIQHVLISRDTNYGFSAISSTLGAESMEDENNIKIDLVLEAAKKLLMRTFKDKIEQEKTLDSFMDVIKNHKAKPNENKKD